MVTAAAPTPIGGVGGVGAVADPVRLRRPGRSRLSGGHLAMLVAGLVGVVLTLALLRGADDRVQVAVAAHDLAPGARLHAADVRYTPVAMTDELLATTLDRAAVERAQDQVVVGPIRAGELVTRGRLRARAASHGRRAMSIPIDPAARRRRRPRAGRPRRRRARGPAGGRDRRPGRAGARGRPGRQRHVRRGNAPDHGHARRRRPRVAAA